MKLVLNSFKEDNEIEQLSIPISLKDPLILSKIQIPVRGTNCTHLQVCFKKKKQLKRLNFIEKKVF